MSDIDFFEASFTYSNASIEVGCCSHITQTLTNVTCGLGASCVGQCSALDASLCPSGNCTGNPEDCKPSLLLEPKVDDHQIGIHRSSATQGSWGINWCSRRCPVSRSPQCCYHPRCYKKRKEQCCWMNYNTGEYILIPDRFPTVSAV